MGLNPQQEHQQNLVLSNEGRVLNRGIVLAPVHVLVLLIVTTIIARTTNMVNRAYRSPPPQTLYTVTATRMQLDRDIPVIDRVRWVL